MFEDRTVLSFGLSEETNRKLSAHVTEAGLAFVRAQNAEALMTAGCFLAVVNRSAIGNSAAKKLARFFAEEDGNLTTRVFLADEPDTLTGAAHAQVFPSVQALTEAFGDVFKKAQNRAKDTARTIGMIQDAFAVSDALKKHPGITTAELAQKTGCRDAAVRRYLEVLRVSGEKVEYDSETQKWRLV